MNCTAIEPSPTAEATRFTLPARTSPTAKDARTPGFEQIGGTAKRPIEPQFGAGLDELFFVQRKAACEPCGIRIGARHYEKMSDFTNLG